MDNETRISFHIRYDLHQLLREEAYIKNITQRSILERGLEMYFDSDKLLEDENDE